MLLLAIFRQREKRETMMSEPRHQQILQHKTKPLARPNSLLQQKNHDPPNQLKRLKQRAQPTTIQRKYAVESTLEIDSIIRGDELWIIKKYLLLQTLLMLTDAAPFLAELKSKLTYVLYSDFFDYYKRVFQTMVPLELREVIRKRSC